MPKGKYLASDGENKVRQLPASHDIVAQGFAEGAPIRSLFYIPGGGLSRVGFTYMVDLRYGVGI